MELVPSWLEALKLEAARQASYWTSEFDSLYLGGGSPSLLSEGDLSVLNEAVRRFRFTRKAEVTLEANPEDVSREKAELWASWGVTRVSLGVQSFDDRFLAGSLGRTHLSSDNYRAIGDILDAGHNLSLDLIYGHPGQEPEDWAADLDKAAASGAKHISAYVLTAMPGTPLAKALAEGLAPKLPGEAKVSDLFLLTAEALKIRGFHRYEVSNFAKGGAECRHNLKYWRMAPYLGLGPAAHSFDGFKRWANLPSVRRWSSSLGRGQTAVDFVEDISPEQSRLERIMLGLRLTEGLEASLVTDLEKLESLIDEGYLMRQGHRIIPSEKGFLAADALARALA
jgi:oxygen-independent coproporphyrinogen-3 oxidase